MVHQIAAKRFHHQLELIYSQAISIVFVVPLVGLFTLLVFWHEDNKQGFLLWISAILILALIRYLLIVNYREDHHKQEHSRIWYRRYLILEVASGLIWASLIIFMFPQDSAQHQLYMMVILAMMAAGASSILSTVLSIYLAFLLSASVPVIIYLSFTPMLSWEYLEYFSALYVIAMVIASIHTSKRHSHTIDIMLQKQNLLSELQQTQKHLEESNRELKQEVRFRLAIEKESKEAEQRFKALAEATNEGIIIYDVDNHGAIIDHNHQALDILGINNTTIKGSPIQEVLRQNELDIRHQAKDIEFSFTTRHDTRFFEGKIRSLPYRGKTHSVITFSDVTEKKLLDAIKNELIATISHELRTPLTSIHASLGLILGGLGGSLDENLKKLLDIAYNNSERLNNLINDILDIHKIQEGQMEYDCRPTKLKAILEDAITLNRPFGDKFKVCFLLEMEDEECCINIDQKRIHQVLTNLLSNAAKFSPEKSDVLIKQSRLGQYCRISVIDHGRGIPESFQPYLFHRFRQADSSDTRQHPGSGLGLSIVKNLIDGMGGRITLHSRENEGTEFHIDFPQCPCDKTSDV